MSFFGLGIAGSAIQAFQEAANTTSDNIANINTPGASRQSVNLTESQPIVGSPGYSTWFGPGTLGDGVLVQSITRIHQDSYDGLFRGASSAQSYFTVQQQQLTAIQASFGEPNNGINTAYTNLQTAISQLASNPTNTAQRQGVISAAQALASALNRVGTAVQNAKTTVQQQAAGVVTQANALIDKIAALNGQIRASTAVGDNPNTFKDQRDQDIDQLSQLVATQTSVQANGSTLVTVGGQALVNDTTAYHLAAPVVGTNASGTPTLVVGMAGDPNPGNPTPVAVGSGQLSGYVDVYNQNLTTYGNSLDSFAGGLANEVDRVTEAGYDQNGNPGAALFTSSVSGQPVSAITITTGISNPTQVTAALASTAAGNLTVPINAANVAVNTANPILGGAALDHPGKAGVTTGSLTVTVNGVAQNFNYDYGAGGNAATIDGFISSFNSAKLGVTASFDTTAQKIVFTRDPSNVSLSARAAQGANATTPQFTIGDSNAAVGGGPGTPSNSILEILGASAISGVAQTNGNAFGAGDNGAANALSKVFSANLGVPALQTTSVGATAAGSVTVSPSTPGAFAGISVGQALTIDAGNPNQENVVVTAINRATGTITFSAANAHVAGFSITSTQQQTIGAYYGALIAKLGLDTSTATTASGAQQTLASNIDAARQSIDGINIDEETQNLVKFQNSYQAAAKTLSVVETLLTTAIGLIPVA